MDTTTPDRSGRPRRIGNPAALAAALAALEPVPVAPEADWLMQLAALEDARQAVLNDREHWLAGAPTVRVMISVIRDNATNCHK